jgi:hypothetical protein
MTGKSWTIFDRLGSTMAFHARQMQKHCEARRALHQSTDRRATKAENKVTLPMSRHRPVINFSRTVADH